MYHNLNESIYRDLENAIDGLYIWDNGDVQCPALGCGMMDAEHVTECPVGQVLELIEGMRKRDATGMVA
jgi:hypothetical protein